MMLNIAICDDEAYYRDKIKNELETILEQRNIEDYGIDTWTSGEELCDNPEKLKEYQIVFLDINMENMTGLDAAKIIKSVNRDIYLVFVTAYVDYAVEGYKVEAIRFLLKDMLDGTLPECMDTVLEKMKYHRHKEKFPFVEGEREVLIYKIVYIESDKHKQIFHVEGEKEQIFSLSGKLEDTQKKLEPYGFIRIHKSFLVNVKMIVDVRNYKVTLKNGKILPVPREKFRQVKLQYFEMMGEI